MALGKVLVTGSSGHLGAALMYHLPTVGYDVVGIDLLPSDTTHETGDIADAAFVSAVFVRHAPTHVVHAAALHKPHVGSHPMQAFVHTNVAGTLALLEAAAAPGSGVRAFVCTSTTSAFGHALVRPGETVWVDEQLRGSPKNIYGATKSAAEDLCALVHAQSTLPVVVLRTARFFPEQDDDAAVRAAFADENAKINELAYRRADIADVVAAHVCALERAPALRWGTYVVSAPPPFERTDVQDGRLARDARAVLAERIPAYERAYAQRGWRFFETLDRVYDPGKAVRELGWRPEHTFERAVRRLSESKEWRSELAIRVGVRGYHAVATGVNTTR